ncbi:MAG: DUF3617 domain-containing protein [Acidobacteriia bacterium]|nr:DUF3617 domain-containing protein [Terriglobia bacterium]
MKTVVLAGLCFLLPLASWSADDYKPLNVKTGLWESTVNTQVSGALPVPAEVLSRLTPEQCARMEAAMKNQEARGPRATSTKSCVTPEDLNKPLTFDAEQKNNCKGTLLRSSSGEQQIREECTQQNMQITAMVHVEAVDSEHVKGTMDMTASGGGNQMNSKGTFTARWIGSDCGDLKKSK